MARRNQRERLFAAMVAVAAKKGYPNTSVADLVELSGVSSRSFYEQFANKEDCFVATLDEILGITQRMAEATLEADGDGPLPAHTAVEALTQMAAAQPAAAKLCSVLAFCAGETPRQRIAQAATDLSALLQREGEEQPDQDRMPAELNKAIFGGVALVLYRRLARDEIEGLVELGPELRNWITGIPVPPRPLRSKARRRAAGERRSGPPPLAAHVPAERILRGFTEVVAEKGYAAATIADVAARARISQNTFYKYFRDKADALEAALDSSGAQMVAATLPAVRREPQWPGALRVALEALCGFMAAEPVFARLREVEVYAVGPEAVAQRDRARGEVVRMLASVADGAEDFRPLAVEATLGAFQSLLYGRIAEGRLRGLAEVPPIVTYLALAPQLGAEEAWEVACG
jgi:AcrR family transcriptional regulator